MNPRMRIAATFAAGLACGLGVSVMLATGKTGESDGSPFQASVMTHGDWVAVWRHHESGAELTLAGVADAETQIAQRLNAEFRYAKQEYGADDPRTLEAGRMIDRFANRR